MLATLNKDSYTHRNIVFPEKLLLWILMSLPLFLTAQPNDKQALLDFMVPFQALTSTDQGSQKDDKWRLQRLDYYHQPENAFFALPSSVSASVACVEGDCMNGEGMATYPTLGASYYGTFQDGYPHERGVVTNAAGRTMIITHYKGIPWGPAALELVDDEKRDYLHLEFQSGDLAKATNFYVPKYRLYYKGLIDDFMPYREGRLYGRGVDAEVLFHEDGRIKGANGKLRYQEGVYYEGKLQWKDNDFTFSERGTLHNENNGTRIDMTFLPNGKPSLQQMSIWRNDTVYVGPVDENLQPHGERGRLMHNGRNFRYGVWKHGVYQGKYGQQPARAATFASNSTAGQENRKFIIQSIKSKLGIDGFSKYTLYEGIPTGNTFSIKADAMPHQFLGIWIINFSGNAQEVCIKPQFYGGSSKKECYFMPPLSNATSDGSLDLEGDAIATLPFNLPSDEGTLRFDITKGNGRDLYILVFPR